MLMPMLNFCVFTLFPAPLSLLRPDPSMGLAHGACILARRDAYEAVGGHAAVRTEIFEDTRLARVWRERGQRGICLDGQHVVRVRMYERLGDIWRGFQKNFYPAFKRDPSFFLFLLFHFWCFLAPFLALPAAIAAGEPWRWFAVAAGCAFAARVVMGLRFGYPLWSSLLHPAAEAMFLALGVSSWLRCRSGRGIEWKGRRYRARAGETKP
jgi:chlorobactene glucosyltransferase